MATRVAVYLPWADRWFAGRLSDEMQHQIDQNIMLCNFAYAEMLLQETRVSVVLDHAAGASLHDARHVQAL
jgi:hypothetical protein